MREGAAGQKGFDASCRGRRTNPRDGVAWGSARAASLTARGIIPQAAHAVHKAPSLVQQRISPAAPHSRSIIAGRATLFLQPAIIFCTLSCPTQVLPRQAVHLLVLTVELRLELRRHELLLPPPLVHVAAKLTARNRRSDPAGHCIARPGLTRRILSWDAPGAVPLPLP
jgi:hypothetical protein